MGEFVVFTEAIAKELIALGYELRGKSKLAWYFDDSEELRNHMQRAFEKL